MSTSMLGHRPERETTHQQPRRLLQYTGAIQVQWHFAAKGKRGKSTYVHPGEPRAQDLSHMLVHSQLSRALTLRSSSGETSAGRGNGGTASCVRACVRACARVGVCVCACVCQSPLRFLGPLCAWNGRAEVVLPAPLQNKFSKLIVQGSRHYKST